MERTTPPFRADHVGSLLRPAALRKARTKFAADEISRADLTRIENEAIKSVITKQEEAGLKGITDGEFRRSWWHLDFLWGLDGFERYVMEDGIAFAGATTRAEGARVVGKVGFSNHPMIDHFKFLSAHTRRTPKVTIPAPSAAYGRIGRKAVSELAYSDLDQFFADLGVAYNKAVHAFAAAGCKYLQLDEVYIAMLCDPKNQEQMRARGDDPITLARTYGDLINIAIEAIPPTMRVTMHLCRGNHKSTFMGSGAYDPVADVLFSRIKAHGYFMEYDTERAGGFEPLRNVPKDRSVALGLVSSKFGQLEDRDVIKRRIEAATKYIDISQLCLSPQCGFASTEEGNLLDESEQWEKLQMIVEIARDIWGDA